MNLFFSAVIARQRDSEETDFLARVANLGPAHETVGRVIARHAELVSDSPTGRELREKYSHAVVIIDNSVRASFVFPDPQAIAAERERAVKRAADLQAEEKRAELAQIESRAAQLRQELGVTEDEEALQLAAAAAGSEKTAEEPRSKAKTPKA